MTDRKINQVLDKLEKNSHLTKDGRAWLISACDPFHDTDITLAGYPDVCSSATIVQLVKKQMVVAPPTGITTQNWDCNITLFNLQGSVNSASNDARLRITANVDQYGFATGGTGLYAYYPVSGVVASSNLTTQQTWPTLSNYNPVATYQGANSVDCSDFVQGACRVIGVAFEVVNTTAEIYKQGQVTVWRQPNVNTLTNIGFVDTGLPLFQATDLLRMPPGDLPTAQLLYGSRSWAAAEGAYVVGRQNGVENPLAQPVNVPFAMTTADYITGVNTPMVYSADTPGAQYVQPILASPFDLSGAYFTGLSPQTTLTVNVRWLLERMPTPSETDLVVLATPSAPYDPLALELYNHCIRDMPPGVMLSENPLGEWFANVLSKVADWAPKIGSALGNFIPGAGLLGNAIGEASSIGARMTRENALDKQPTPGSNSQSAPSAPTTATTSRVQTFKNPMIARRRKLKR
jgi:hypothetical protein